MITPGIFREYKRHYHKVHDIADALFSKGTFKLQIRGDQTSLQAKFESPDDEKTIRFIVLMRRFLGTSDSLYYRKICDFLFSEFNDVISSEMLQRVNEIIARLNQGDISINIDGENLTAERIYQAIADGEYFGENKDAQQFLKKVSGTPIIGLLFWQQFHAYTVNAYVLASVLFDIILEIEKSEKYRLLYNNKVLGENHCIYCLTKTGKFTSEEHIFPESLGNDEFVLPKGYVCDKCNNEVLARLDNTLLKFPPIAMLQVQFVHYTKDGKLPSANLQNASMKRTSPRNVTIIAKDKTARMKNKKELGNGWISFTLNFTGGKFNPKLLGRSLYKIALGMVAYSQSRDKACDAKYNLAREYIFNGVDFPNNLLLKKETQPHPQMRVTYQDLSGTPFAIDIFGLLFLLNLEPFPVIQFNENINSAQFMLYELHD